MPSHLPPKVCENCDAEVGDDEPYCPACGNDLGPSEVREKRRAEAVEAAAANLREAWDIFRKLVAIFGGVCWIQMFLVATPRWALVAEPVVVLLLAGISSMDPLSLYFSIKTSPAYRRGARKSPWTRWLRGARMALHDVKVLNRAFGFESVACLSALAILVVAPAWTGWRWVFPVAGAIPCLLFVVGRWIHAIVD